MSDGGVAHVAARAAIMNGMGPRPGAVGAVAVRRAHVARRPVVRGQREPVADGRLLVLAVRVQFGDRKVTEGGGSRRRPRPPLDLDGVDDLVLRPARHLVRFATDGYGRAAGALGPLVEAHEVLAHVGRDRVVRGVHARAVDGRRGDLVGAVLLVEILRELVQVAAAPLRPVRDAVARAARVAVGGAHRLAVLGRGVHARVGLVVEVEEALGRPGAPGVPVDEAKRLAWGRTQVLVVRVAKVLPVRERVALGGGRAVRLGLLQGYASAGPDAVALPDRHVPDRRVVRLVRHRLARAVGAQRDVVGCAARAHRVDDDRPGVMTLLERQRRVHRRLVELAREVRRRQVEEVAVVRGGRQRARARVERDRRRPQVAVGRAALALPARDQVAAARLEAAQLALLERRLRVEVGIQDGRRAKVGRVAVAPRVRRPPVEQVRVDPKRAVVGAVGHAARLVRLAQVAPAGVAADIRAVRDQVAAVRGLAEPLAVGERRHDRVVRAALLDHARAVLPDLARRAPTKVAVVADEGAPPVRLGHDEHLDLAERPRGGGRAADAVLRLHPKLVLKPVALLPVHRDRRVLAIVGTVAIVPPVVGAVAVGGVSTGVDAPARAVVGPAFVRPEDAAHALVHGQHARAPEHGLGVATDRAAQIIRIVPVRADRVGDRVVLRRVASAVHDLEAVAPPRERHLVPHEHGVRELRARLRAVDGPRLLAALAAVARAARAAVAA